MDSTWFRQGFSGFVSSLLLMTLLGSGASAAPPEPTPISGPDADRGGTVVKDIRELRFFDANGDSHVFELEELPVRAKRGRGGVLQISPVASGTYATDTDYLLIHPFSGAVDFAGPGPVRLHGSNLQGFSRLDFADANGDGLAYRFREIPAREGPFSGALLLSVGPVDQPNRNAVMAIFPGDETVGFAGNVVVRGKLGVEGIPVVLGEPLDADGKQLRGLPDDPCGTCAVRLDYLDGDGDGRVDAAESVESLDGATGCESGQFCTRTLSVSVPAGGTKRVEFEEAFRSGLPQLVQNETFRPTEDAENRVPAVTVESILREDGAVTGVVLRNGHAARDHSVTVGIQGVVR